MEVLKPVQNVLELAKAAGHFVTDRLTLKGWDELPNSLPKANITYISTGDKNETQQVQ